MAKTKLFFQAWGANSPRLLKLDGDPTGCGGGADKSDTSSSFRCIQPRKSERSRISTKAKPCSSHLEANREANSPFKRQVARSPFSLNSPHRWRENEYDVRLRQEEERRSKEREDEQRRKDNLERRSWSNKQEKERNNGNSIRSTSWQKNRNKGATDFYLRKERYDPFAFQSTPKPKVLLERLNSS